MGGGDHLRREFDSRHIQTLIVQEAGDAAGSAAEIEHVAARTDSAGEIGQDVAVEGLGRQIVHALLGVRRGDLIVAGANPVLVHAGEGTGFASLIVGAG